MTTQDEDRRTSVVEKIGLSLAEASEKSRKTDPDPRAFLKRETVILGFDKMAQPIPLADFMTLPFGERNGPDEDNWFEQHLKFLELSVEKRKFEEAKAKTVAKILPELPKIKYKRYFNIFPNGSYEDTILSAVYDLWQSNALANIRMTPD